MTELSHEFRSYKLEDRYEQTQGRVFLTGTQALARVMLDQARRDRLAGLNTAGFVSGYRGSPLGAVDLEFWRSRQRMEENRVTFMPAVNEDLGATAVLGAQQAILDPHCEVEGVFSMWYGKGPGVDRSGDALKHGNAYGSSAKGGVLVVAGDDHGCVSSSMPHQSDVAFMSWFMPVLNPADVSEFLTYGEYGFALSRYSGTWVGFKAVSETVESARSVELQADRDFTYPDLPDYPGGLHIRRADLPSPEIETRIRAKIKAVRAFAEANPIDRRIYDVEEAKFGFVTTGKGHLDLMEALRLLGLDEGTCRRLGIDIYKVGMVWPLARPEALRFMRGKDEVLVVEEKRGIIESQFKEYFYDWPGDKPNKMVGKYDSAGEPLIPWTGELSPLMLAPIVAARLDRFFPGENLPARAAALLAAPPKLINVPGANRTPYFCSGCPHNSSTKLPEGSEAKSGIGCHVMASWMDRETSGYAQMGGEGVTWTAASQYNGGKHIFQNLGEGTWYHSGSLAIRQAVAARTNITYKILYNDAVAMTGGQPVDGPVSVLGIAQTCRAEGVQRIALVSDNIDKFNRGDFPSGTTFHDRAEMDQVQRELREVKGVSCLIYEQTCATEKRRRRKRGTMEDPKKFAFINDLVCEGCGDCSIESNCLSVEPKETAFGRKRKINLSSCNKDFSCVKGFCPSFVTVEGGALRKPEKPEISSGDIDIQNPAAGLSEPTPATINDSYNILVTGIGGTGVVTVGALLGMAAHLEGKGATILDQTGLAQKNGAVMSHVRITNDAGDLSGTRIPNRQTDLVVGCDLVVAAGADALASYGLGRTRAIINDHIVPVAAFTLAPDLAMDRDTLTTLVAESIGREKSDFIDSTTLATAIMGDSIAANLFLLGYAFQKGTIPLSLASIEQAIELNGVAIESNKRSFAWGRKAASDLDAVEAIAKPTASAEIIQKPLSLDEMISDRQAELTEYQSKRYAKRYLNLVDKVRAAEAAIGGDDLPLTNAVARYFYKLMAYKDEFEVARLYTSGAFEDKLKQQFEGDFKLKFHMAPPLLAKKDPETGHLKKQEFGPWMFKLFGLMAKMRFLRGTALDPFGKTEERIKEKELIKRYEDTVQELVGGLSGDNLSLAIEIAEIPEHIRGYGHVKERHLQSAEAEWDSLLSKFRSGETERHAAQ